MANPYGSKAYKKTSIQTASKEKVLLMLYEGCIRYFKKCKLAIENNDLNEKGVMLGKAQDIVNELCSTLNHSVGGDISKQLEGLYLFIFEESTKANIENDPKKIQNCINILETLYSGWKEAIDNIVEEKAPQKTIDIKGT